MRATLTTLLVDEEISERDDDDDEKVSLLVDEEVNESDDDDDEKVSLLVDEEINESDDDDDEKVSLLVDEEFNERDDDDDEKVSLLVDEEISERDDDDDEKVSLLVDEEVNESDDDDDSGHVDSAMVSSARKERPGAYEIRRPDELARLAVRRICAPVHHGPCIGCRADSPCLALFGISRCRQHAIRSARPRFRPGAAPATHRCSAAINRHISSSLVCPLHT
jgi:hypothetical protein